MCVYIYICVYMYSTGAAHIGKAIKGHAYSLQHLDLSCNPLGVVGVLQCVAVCCSVLQCVAVIFSATFGYVM